MNFSVLCVYLLFASFCDFCVPSSLLRTLWEGDRGLSRACLSVRLLSIVICSAETTNWILIKLGVNMHEDM